MATHNARLASVEVKGGLWGPDLLAALADDRHKLPADTVAADSYGLPRRASTEQTARAAWTVLTAAWEEFTEHHQRRIATFETPNYGADSFTWDKWTRHLLDQLGYDPEMTAGGGLTVDQADPDDPADSFPITHTHQDQLPIHAVPAGAPLDARTSGVSGAARQSPHSLLQHYLNRTSRHLWGIVTNGTTLRLLRDNAALSRQAYIEFDLAGIFDEGAYADFALLWHAAHATRFVHDDDQPAAACIAETWQDHATKTGVAALEDLRDGVEDAITQIGQGLIEHPDNRALRDALANPDDPFDANAFYRQLLYIAYRHVFWFALDDRNLLHPDGADRSKVALYRDHYASTVLRSKARAHLGARHPDGWRHFHTVAGWFSNPDGRSEVAVSGLLGRLWDPRATSDLNDTTLENRRYYEALRRLAYVQRDGVMHRINYDAMGSEELGAVYESLLEIRPVADPVGRTFAPDRTHGSDRKRTGSYYTPTSLIKVLLDEALDPVLDDRIKKAVHQLPPGATPEQHEAAQVSAILGTTICDSAMGSAHFLVAAGMRVAKRLAEVRTGEIEPGPDAIQQAFRDVASRCLYGVDLNPMAVELAKLAIWLECHVPGQPLTFLDHHLKHGNALLGVGFDTELIAWRRTAKKAADQKGVPESAFKPLAGDDKQHARTLRDRNKDRRGRGTSLRFHSAGAHQDELDRLADNARQLANLGDDTPAALVAKQEAWAAYEDDAELKRQRLRADAWIACWTITKTLEVTDPLITDDPLADDDLPWDVYYDTFFDERIEDSRPGVRAVRAEADRLNFFHWYVEFPQIAAAGGFSLCVGNPPWERLKLQEREWFAAAGYGDIAIAKNASLRKKMVAALATSDDPVDRQAAILWERDSRDAQATSEFARNAGRFPLGGVGDVNTYALFADHFVRSVSASGRVGIIVPTGLITDYTYREFFATLVDQRRLVGVYDFINKRGIFPEIQTVFQFALLVAAGSPTDETARFSFNALDVADLELASRRYELAPEQILLVNPNTMTAPVFLTARDAAITTKVYERHPVLVHKGRDDGNPWGIAFGTMFHMANDSALFHAADQLRSEGWTLNGNIFIRDDERMLPLHEAKMFGLFDSDSTTYEGVAAEKVFGVKVGTNPTPRGMCSMPRYWVHRSAVEEQLAGRWDEDFMLVWRDITRATQSSRTTVTSLVPRTALPDSSLIAMPEGGGPAAVVLLAALGSFAFDYIARQKLSGMHLKFYIMEQLPVPAPAAFLATRSWSAGPVGDWVGRRAAALSASTAHMASALGYDRPVGWDAGRRELWRTELDAAMFHLYGYARPDVEHVMESFTVVARRDRQAEGLAAEDLNWRTKRLILSKYDELARHAEAGTKYESPEPPPPLPEDLCLTSDAEAH